MKLLHYDVGFAFPTPIRRVYREGTFPPCILNIPDEQNKSDEQVPPILRYVQPLPFGFDHFDSTSNFDLLNTISLSARMEQLGGGLISF
eukprot:4320050-Ditylum_brightwellii.AAC.1